MNWINRIVRAYATEAEIEARMMYAKVCGFFFGMLVLGGIAGILNITEHRNWILLPMFAGMIITPICAFLPKIVFIAMGLGALVDGLKDKDITQGSVAGIIYWYRFFLGTFLVFTIFMGVLFIWSFAKSPAWLITGLIGAIILVTAIAYFKMKTGMWQWIVVLTSAGLIVLSFWFTRPDGVFPGTGDVPATPPSAASTANLQPRVTGSQEVILPAQGKSVVERLGTCSIDSRPKENRPVMENTHETLTYTSSNDKDVTFTVYFYEPGMLSCEEAFASLGSQAFK